MNDQHKTKAQLIEELEQGRKRVAELEQAEEVLRESQEQYPRIHSLPSLTDLKPGDHLCCIYATEEEHKAVLTPFMRQGLEQGEKVIYIVDAHTVETILEYLRGDGLHVEPYLGGGFGTFYCVPSDELSLQFFTT